MHIDKKLLQKLFLFVAGAMVFGWVLLDTQRVRHMLEYLWGLVSPFAVGAVIAFVFNVPMRAIEGQLMDVRKEGLRRGMSILLTIMAMFLIVFFVVELLVPQIRQTVASLQEKIPVFVDRTAQKLMVFMADNPEIQEWVKDVLKMDTINWSNILQNILTFLGNQVSTVMGGAVNVIGNVAGALVDLVISIVFAIYCLARKDILARQGRRILYSVLPEHTTDEILRIMQLTNGTFSSFISGQCLEACILGALFALSMAILKMPYIPLVSVIIAVTALIPVVGAFVGCFVGAFFILVNDPIQAATFVAMFLVLQQLENNLIYPRVVGTSIGLPGMWVLVAVTIGGEVMGVAGMLLMIPLASVLYTLAREFTNRRLAERNIPEEKLHNNAPAVKTHFQKNKERLEQLRIRKMREKFKKIHEQKNKK